MLDLGCNCLRNKGAQALAKALFDEGSVSRLEVISLKNNFINEKGFKPLISGISSKIGPMSDKELSLKALLMAGNDISLYELRFLERVLKEMNWDLYVDSLERLKFNTDAALFFSGVNARVSE